jgi:hypothetical protein
MSVYKNIEPENVLISSFKVHKTFTLTEADSGSGLYVIPIYHNRTGSYDGHESAYDTSTALSTTITGSVFQQVPSWYSINTLYYRDIRTMRGYIDYITGVPSNKNAIISNPTTTVERVTYNPELDVTVPNIELRRPYTRQLHDSATVISVPTQYYGECIQPSSVRITDNSTESTYILEDDGRGNIYDVEYSSSYANRIPNAKMSGSVIGNVFYNDGVIVITETGSYATVGTKTGTDGFTLKFNATQTIYEREYVCVVGENEFQHTTNKSLKVGYSSSFDMGIFKPTPFTNTIDDDFPYSMIGYATHSYNVTPTIKNQAYDIGTKLIGEATHSEFATYVTNIGLYNSERELLAIGTTGRPIKNDKELSLTFVVRFDTN